MRRERYFRRLRTIPSKMAPFFTIIVLDSCYILRTIAFCLLILDSTRLRSILLIKAVRLLVYLPRFLLLRGRFPLATSTALEELNVFRRSSNISRWLWICAKVFMCSEWVMTSFTCFQRSKWLGSAGITFKTCSSLEISRPAALRSWTMALVDQILVTVTKLIRNSKQQLQNIDSVIINHMARYIS